MWKNAQLFTEDSYLWVPQHNFPWYMEKALYLTKDF